MAEEKEKKNNKPEAKSPFPKPQTFKEALQIALNKEVIKRNENGEEIKTTFLEELASKAIADAIANDGPTRRLLFRPEILDLKMIEVSPDEQESEVDFDDPNIIEVEKEYGKLLREMAEMTPGQRKLMRELITMALIDITNKKTRAESND